jgi:hypothetical protein
MHHFKMPLYLIQDHDVCSQNLNNKPPNKTFAEEGAKHVMVGNMSNKVKILQSCRAHMLFGTYSSFH